MVERQVRSMARLVDDLLDVSRITRGKIQLRKEPVNLCAVVQHAVETTRPLYHARDQPLSLDIPSEPLRLQADPMRLEQIVVNLLNNASKYSERGEPVALEVAQEGNDVVIRVRDHGIGIDAAMMPRVFDLFAQADQTLDRAHGGLGIGLTLVRSLAQMHGGTVTCRSDGLGRGSEFLVRMPLVPAETPDEPPAPTESLSSPRYPLRVLVIDDNRHAAESLALIVKLWGHESRLAHDGHGAFEVVDAFQPEVVLLDIGLPGMDGYTVCRRIRERTAQNPALMIATTGYGRDEDRSRSRESGFDHHLVKPLDLDQLESLLALHRSTATPPPTAD
jgi:CheY-like chemotaxis protein